MSIHYDKLSFTKDHVKKVAEDLRGEVTEDELFYNITFPPVNTLSNEIEERVKRREKLIAKLLEMQKADLSLIGESEPMILTKEKILRVVLKCHRRKFDSVFWKHRATGRMNQERKNVKIRQMYFYLSSKLTDNSLKEIGRIKRIGKTHNIFDHSTVIHGIKTYGNLIECYKSDERFHESVVKYLES